MPSPLTWLFQLHDGMSGPAKTIAGNLGEVQQASEGLGASIIKLAEGVGLERLVEKVADLGKEFISEVFHANEFATRTKVSLEVLTGSAEKASDVFEESRRVAVALGVPLEQVASSYKALLLGGESATNLQVVTKAAADLAALKGGSIQEWAQAFADIQSKGDLAGRSLIAFKGALDFDVLAKKLGFATHGYEQLAKALTASPVAAHKGIEAILQTIAVKEGGAIETISAKLADTFGGTIASIKEEMLGVFEFDSTNSPILGFLHDVRDALRPEGPLVKQIREGIAGVVTGFSEFVKSGDFSATVRDMTASLGALADTLKLITWPLRQLVDLKAKLNEYNRVQTGIDEAQALRARQDEELRVLELQKDFAAKSAAGIPTGFAADLGIAAPPIGAHPHRAEAFAEGGVVNRPTLAVVGEAGEREYIIPEHKMGGASVSVSMPIYVTVQGLSTEETGRKIAEIAAAHLQPVWDTLAEQMGTS